jgi:hypothetical protein
MMKRLAIIISLMFCVLGAGAQNIISVLGKSGQGGEVVLEQPKALTTLMSSRTTVKTSNGKVEGYRVLVYSGNNSAQAREEANEMAAYMRKNFPGANVYVEFHAPMRTCEYGDYRTREEAELVMYRLRATRRLKGLSVKKCVVNLPY